MSAMTGMKMIVGTVLSLTVNAAIVIGFVAGVLVH